MHFLIYGWIGVIGILRTGWAFSIIPHPLEKRAAYIHGISSINDLKPKVIEKLKDLFLVRPLLIFKGVKEPTPNEFLHFLTHFDKDCDIEAIRNPDKYPHQILQPFDRFPECPHVAPRGNARLTNFHQISNITVFPDTQFEKNYLWHTDLLGSPNRLLGVITGFYILESPLIGGDTDFISGEAIFQSLSEKEQLAAGVILTEVNRLKFLQKRATTDYSGSYRMEKYIKEKEGNIQIPILFPPSEEYGESPSILLLPTFFERVMGWSVEESREWMKYMMIHHALPNRFSIQWKKGDLCVFNNRRFMHSSTPTRNYMDFSESSTRLLLQTFVPTKRPLYGYQLLHTDKLSTYHVNNWASSQVSAIDGYSEFMQYYNEQYNNIKNKFIISQLDKKI
jgi:alpha-ketoglutarate-dependent taurine dioxygenase